jgi:hypothetical protein
MQQALDHRQPGLRWTILGAPPEEAVSLAPIHQAIDGCEWMLGICFFT